MKKVQRRSIKRQRKIIIIMVWLLIWQMISLLMGNSILLVGPVETFFILLKKMTEADFWKTIVFSLCRITAGFLAGWILGLLLSAVSAAKEWIEDIIRPVMTLMKTVPVASFVVLFLIWFRSGMLAVAISLCVVLPNVYLQTLEGIKSTDVKLLEMARVYDIHPMDKFMYIYRPALKPFWDGCMKISVGMSWKSGIAAEVIGTPDLSIGEQLYMSKIYFDTAGVLAWTVVIIGISVLCEVVFLRLWGRFMEWQPGCKGPAADVHKEEVGDRGEILISLRDICKSYGDNHLFRNLDAVFRRGEIYYFRTPSGSGKTTLFRMIAGLEETDQGRIVLSGKSILAFQEDRLCETFSAVKNVELITGDRKKAVAYLKPLLEEEDLEKPCSCLSGGMKRRVVVARAFAAEKEIVLLDEPLAGLDEENRVRMQAYIEKHGQDKAILLATHV